MKLEAMGAAACAAQLAGGGVRFRTGPFVTHLRADFPDLAAAFHFVYGDHERIEGGFADFHVQVVRPRGLRGWYRPQALFVFDGMQPFLPYPGHATMPLFEWGLNWCIASQANDYLIVHAAVLEKNGRAVILPAKPGSGKSTLCAALAFRGWRLLSDEMALIRPDDGRIDPLPRPIGLKDRSIEVLRAFEPSVRLGPVWPDTGKGDVSHLRPPVEAVERCRESAEPAWIVFPRWKEGAPARFTPEEKAGAFLRVVDNSMNFSVLGETGFAATERLLDASSCLSFEYGRLEEAIGAFDELA